VAADAVVGTMSRSSQLAEALEERDLDQVIEVLAEAFPHGLWVQEEQRIIWDGQSRPEQWREDGYLLGDELMGVAQMTDRSVELVSYVEATGKAFLVELYPEHLPDVGPVIFYKEAEPSYPIPELRSIQVERRFRISSEHPFGEPVGELRLDLSHAAWH